MVLLKKQRPTARNAVLGTDTRLSFVDGSLTNEWMPKSHYVLIPRRTLSTRCWIRGIETHKQWRGCHRKAGSKLSYDEYENAIAEAVNQLNSPTTAKVGSLVATASTTRKRLFPQCLSQNTKSRKQNDE